MKKHFKNVTLYFIATLLVAVLMYCIIMITILNRELEAMQEHLIYIEELYTEIDLINY